MPVAAHAAVRGAAPRVRHSAHRTRPRGPHRPRTTAAGARSTHQLNSCPLACACAQKYHAEGFKIVIFSNQGSIKSALTGRGAEKIKSVMEQVFAKIGVPVAAAFMATQKDDFRKPFLGMWQFMCDRLTDGVKPDLQQSFFVGDAAGRPGDHSDSDKEFASNVGLEFRLPNDVFEMGEGGGAGMAGGRAGGGRCQRGVVLTRGARSGQRQRGAVPEVRGARHVLQEPRRAD